MIDSPMPFLLTIAIPTYNRIECLKLLLENLLKDIRIDGTIFHKVEILICNNSSTDGTGEYLNSMSGENNIRVVHHQENCGGDANIVYCCEAARAKYLWIIGDDDLPMRGALTALINILEDKEPDLLYLPSVWKIGDLRKYSDSAITSYDLVSVDKMGMAVAANIYVTFISSWIMNMDTYKKSSGVDNISQFKGSSLSQLEWILSLLSYGKKLYFLRGTWIFACAGASGNYSLFEVFSTNFNKIIEKKFGAEDVNISSFLRNAMLRCFLPGLIWSIRNNTAGCFEKFESEKVLSTLKITYNDSLFFNTLIVPIARYNLQLANYFRYVARFFSKIWLSLSKKTYISK